MQDEADRDRAGRFFLKQRGKQGTWYICWYNPATGQADRISTGTGDREAARTALYEHALRNERPATSTDAQLAHVMLTCWEQYGRHLPSAHTHLAAQRDALEIWGDVSVSELDRQRQLEFVRAMRVRGLSDWTISTRLRRIWATMNWYRRDNSQLVVPDQITAADWRPDLQDRDQTYSLPELAALFNTAADQTADLRYTREHWWRFLVLAVGTAARPGAIRELTWQQVDLRLGRIRLNPEGAQAYHARGLIYQRQGDNVQAITDFNNAIDRDPFAGAPYQARGQSLMASGKYQAAIEDFNAALNVDANNSEAWSGLGLCYEKLNNHAKAVESYQRAVTVDPNNSDARAALRRLS